jgi:glucose-6-phosphate isomerase
VVLTLYRDQPSSDTLFRQFIDDDVLARLEALDRRVRKKGLASLDPTRNRFIPLGTEIDAHGRVTKNNYGVFHLPWRAREDGDWPARIEAEVEQIKAGIRKVHGVRLRFLIWAGVGGSAEDKVMYQAAGLLRRGPRLYVLDSTDPAKLKHILEDMTKRSKLPLGAVLRSTLVVGMAMGMTSREPVVNLDKISALFEKHGVQSRPNFLYLTIPGSLLDQYGSERGYRRVELQMDGGNSTTGRHSGPMTRGSLYPLGLAGADMRRWIEGTFLDQHTIRSAWQLSSYLQMQSSLGRDKVTLLLPKSWAGAGMWTKQDFEGSLGKSEEAGIQIVEGERVKLANYWPPKDSRQDRVFLALLRRGDDGTNTQKVAALKRAGYPVACVNVPKDAPLSEYMQFIHYVVFGLGYLRDMNFVTQPGVESYESITGKIHAEGQKSGGADKSGSWAKLTDPEKSVKYRGGVSLHFPFIEGCAVTTKNAAQAYAQILRHFAEPRTIDTGELTFFGDTRYSHRGRAVRKVLDRAAEEVFRSRLRMPADVYEGPAMSHSCHEMIVGHRRRFSTMLISVDSDSNPNNEGEYHRAQFLAAQIALSACGRPVVAILMDNLGETGLRALGEFFQSASRYLK